MTRKENEMKATTKIMSALIFGVSVASVALAEADASPQQELLSKVAPRGMKLIIASFGTINSQSEVENWLGDQLRPLTNMDEPPTLSEADKVANPNLNAMVVRANWQTKKMEYIQSNRDIQRENARRMKVMTNLKTHMLSASSQRYTQIGRDYLQSRIRKQVGNLIQVVDRGNMSIQQIEKQIKGMDADMVNGADCVLSVVMGDREEDSKTIPIDNVGTKIKRTTYTAPYVGKIRDLDGNVLLAFDGTVEWRKSQDNVVKSVSADPARKLMESVCDKIAKEVVDYFTTKLVFKVKAPEGVDEDDAEIFVDGREVSDCEMRVLAVEHVVKATLDGCKPISKVIEIENETPVKKVKLNFKKKGE